MEFFDKIGKKAAETCNGVVEKTGKIAKEAKLKMKINENKSKISDIYEEMGKKVYQKHVADEEVCIKKDLEEECAKIDILSSEIESYRVAILELSDIKICDNCKEHISRDAKFCPQCGAEQPKIEENTKECMEVEVINEDEQEQEKSKEQDYANEEDKQNIEEQSQENNDSENHEDGSNCNEPTYTEGEITKKENE